MKTEPTMIYWRAGNFWLGKLKEHPEIMTQGRTLKELKENLRDAYMMMVMDDVPEQYLAIQQPPSRKQRHVPVDFTGDEDKWTRPAPHLLKGRGVPEASGL
jgi:predicted RNase H-like HicB family nuclease